MAAGQLQLWVASSCSLDVTAEIQRPICLHLMVVVRRTPETRHWAVSRVNACMDAVTDIDTQPEQRSRLLDWYVNRLCSGDDRKGQAAFQRDLQRLYELDRIEEYLERLDEEIRVANRRALVFLEYMY